MKYYIMHKLITLIMLYLLFFSLINNSAASEAPVSIGKWRLPSSWRLDGGSRLFRPKVTNKALTGVILGAHGLRLLASVAWVNINFPSRTKLTSSLRLLVHCNTSSAICNQSKRLRFVFSGYYRKDLHSADIDRGTDSTKINRPGHNIRMYWTHFRQPTAHV